MSKSLISANQATKLAHKLILLIIIFLDPVVKYEEKTHAYHAIEGAIGKMVRK